MSEHPARMLQPRIDSPIKDLPDRSIRRIRPQRRIHRNESDFMPAAFERRRQRIIAQATPAIHSTSASRQYGNLQGAILPFIRRIVGPTDTPENQTDYPPLLQERFRLSDLSQIQASNAGVPKTTAIAYSFFLPAKRELPHENEKLRRLEDMQSRAQIPRLRSVSDLLAGW